MFLWKYHFTCLNTFGYTSAISSKLDGIRFAQSFIITREGNKSISVFEVYKNRPDSLKFRGCRESTVQRYCFFLNFQKIIRFFIFNSNGFSTFASVYEKRRVMDSEKPSVEELIATVLSDIQQKATPPSSRLTSVRWKGE